MGFWDFLPWVPDGPGNGTNGGVIRGGVEGNKDTESYSNSRKQEKDDQGTKAGLREKARQRAIADGRAPVRGLNDGVIRGGVTGNQDTEQYANDRYTQAMPPDSAGMLGPEYANWQQAPRFPAQVAREMDATAARMRELSAFPPPDRWSPSPAQVYNNLQLYPNPELLAWYGQYQPGVVQFMNEAARLDALHREFNSMQQDPRNGPPVQPTNAPVPQQLIDLLSALAEEEYQRRSNSGQRGAATRDW